MKGLNKISGKSIESITDHITQSVNDILTTPVGTRLMRRNYGSDVPELLDQPMNAATRLRLYTATATALMKWEPRLQVSRVEFSVIPPAGAMLTITGTVNGARYAGAVELRAN